MGKEVMILCEALAIGRGDRPILHDINLQVHPGERIGLVGRNGIGKSTLLRTLAGFLAPCSGRAQVAGAEIGKTSPHALARRGVVFIGEDRGVFLSLTVAEHIMLSTRRPYVSKDAEEITEPLPSIGLRESTRVVSLSGGERQVLGLGCALARDPRVLLVDELSQGVNVETRTVLLERIQTQLQAGGAAMIFTDEDSSVVRDFSTRWLDLG
jgi:branched-chain amino acid transport system ATP-binding protein